MRKLIELQHPLVEHHLTKLRDKSISSASFRAIVRRLAYLLAYEATKDLGLDSVSVETPISTVIGSKLSERIGVVPILRAGLGMVEPVLDLIPTAEVWHLGFYRDEQTHRPVEYYSKLPDESPVSIAMVVDPMLATGGSAGAAIKALCDWGVRKIRLLAIIAAPEGVKFVQSQYPETEIYVCGVDQCLNENAYIVPGLGDAGDRIFNTPADLS